ncbi:Carbohydrate family 9 binding domain-like [Paenibacillaceae bacterium GAS479]|nr:Carbohydrate family 9 binding domain-like [Paenibacillaceae bacterium GAS479]
MSYDNVPEPSLVFDPKHYVCRKSSEPLVLDGRLDKPFWSQVPWTDDFVDIEGDLRPKPTKQTRVKMAWDDEYFYFGAELIEDEIWATLTERDSVIFYDNDFEIFIDPDGDTHQYYEFEMNAFNTVWDLLLVKPYRDGGPPVNGWDIHGLKTAVHIDGEINKPGSANRKWSLEVAMPWSALKECAKNGRPPEAGEYWRVNFSRVEWHTDIVDGQYVKRKNEATGKSLPEENWVWSPMGIINMHYPELWGLVWFAEGDQPMDTKLPQVEIAKWELRKLYYRQRKHYAEHGQFCDNLSALMSDDSWTIEPHLEAAKEMFHISARLASGEQVHIREDSRVWVS